MYSLSDKSISKIEPTTFAKLNMKEYDVEELLRKNVDMICEDDETSLLIVGQQVTNVANARSDLTAIDNNGNLVLIEIKRDEDDIKNRREAFEFQAIRYAASIATIEDENELIQSIYAPYVEKHKDEYKNTDNLTYAEIAKRLFEDFKTQNNITSFNERQRIILVASGFDEQTLSAVAWLNSNKVDISCYEICPYTLNNEIIIDMKKILPLTEYDDYYVDVTRKKTLQKKPNTDITRRSLPKIDSLLKWGVVAAGDILIAKDSNPQVKVELLANGNVKVGNEEKTIQSWLKSVYGWSSVQTYAFSIQEKSGRTLSDLRREYMNKMEKE